MFARNEPNDPSFSASGVVAPNPMSSSKSSSFENLPKALQHSTEVLTNLKVLLYDNTEKGAGWCCC
jgi:hypothetical protein